VSRRQEFANQIQDDATNIAGWVFADLLLSLAVIFLASISFAVPGKSGDSVPATQNSGAVVTMQGQQPEFNSPLAQGFNFYYSKFDKQQIENDLSAYFQRENLSPNTQVIYAQIAGGFDSGSEGSELGTMRALEFSISLKKANVKAFEKANFDLTTSNQLAKNQIALRLSFVPPLQGSK
jgi:hypothetical protein